MNITTKDLIKILPFEKTYRERLFEKFDMLNPDQKSALSEILWKTYRELRKARIDENLQLAFLKAGKNQENLDQSFYKRALEKTDKELGEEATKTVTQFDLTSTRHELAEMVGQATKNPKKS